MKRRRLHRSTTDKRLAGVCGGLAEYFDIDPLLVRIGFVITALAGGPGLIAYLVLWIAVPKGPPGATAAQA
jgi:phage shock protein C